MLPGKRFENVQAFALEVKPTSNKKHKLNIALNFDHFTPDRPRFLLFVPMAIFAFSLHDLQKPKIVSSQCPIPERILIGYKDGKENLCLYV